MGKKKERKKGNNIKMIKYVLFACFVAVAFGCSCVPSSNQLGDVAFIGKVERFAGTRGNFNYYLVNIRKIVKHYNCDVETKVVVRSVKSSAACGRELTEGDVYFFGTPVEQDKEVRGLKTFETTLCDNTRLYSDINSKERQTLNRFARKYEDSCSLAGEGEGCVYSEDCDPSTYCMNGICEKYIPCSNDMPCDEGMFCTYNFEGKEDEMRCKHYSATGESCGGYTLASYINMCNPETHSCVNLHSPMIADIPGSCLQKCSTPTDACDEGYTCDEFTSTCLPTDHVCEPATEGEEGPLFGSLNGCWVNGCEGTCNSETSTCEWDTASCAAKSS